MMTTTRNWRSRERKTENGKTIKNVSPTTLAHQQRLVPHPCQTCCVVRGSTRMGRWPGALCAAETAGEAVDGEKGDDDGGIDVVVVVACFARPPSGQGRPTIGKRGPIATREAGRERKGSVDERAEKRREGSQCAKKKERKMKKVKSEERATSTSSSTLFPPPTTSTSTSTSTSLPLPFPAARLAKRNRTPCGVRTHDLLVATA